MSISSLRWPAASALIAVGAAAAAVLAVAVPAGASTGPRYASAEQAGYAATGAQFDMIRASIYLRNPMQYAGEVSQYSHTVQLWSSGLVAVLGVSASTSGTGYTPYAKIFDASTHQLLASNPHAQFCGELDNCGPVIGTFGASDTVEFILTYGKNGGGIELLALDESRGETSFVAYYTAGAGVSFTQARVGTEFGPDPWTAPSSYTHPAAWTKIGVYDEVQVQTYNGTWSTLASWFVHHKIFMAAVTGSLIDVQAAPTDLSPSPSGGSLFQDWLAPAGVNGPAQPPGA
jgi:hypothetical protein